MVAGEGQLSRWTRYFTVASASVLVLVQAVPLLGGDRHLMAVLAVFGFICPMIFGMGYLLLPSFVGRTLAHQRLPGIHFVLAYTGTAAIVGGRFLGPDESILSAGIVLWSLGVVLFLGELLWTIRPAIFEQPGLAFSVGNQSGHTARLPLAMIPVALGYLLIGTVALLGRVDLVPRLFPPGFATISHYYAAGFGALLMFAIGVRLMPGFFHVDLPKPGVSVVLVSGAVGPGLLGTFFLRGVWFRAGALLEVIAIIGYAVLVASVYRRSDRLRSGFYGILLGAIAGTVAVGFGLAVVVGGGVRGGVTGHVGLMLTGFFALTIIGYVFQFYPVTTGHYFGASGRTAIASIAGIAIGATLQAAGQVIALPSIERGGALFAVFGTGLYWYLSTRRILPT